MDQQELQRLNQELELLKQQEAVKEEAATVAQRDAMNAAEDALDKYKNKNTIKDSDGNVIKSFDSRVYEALKIGIGHLKQFKSIMRFWMALNMA